MRIIPLPLVLTACLAAMPVAFAPVRADAQTVYGVVVSDRTGEPVEGATVLLADTLGLSRASALADSLGRFAITAPRPGRYTLAADRVGYESLTPDTVTIPADSLQVQLRAGSRRITLPPFTASARSRCAGHLETSPQTGVVWAEARKALAAAALLEERGGYQYVWRVDRREVRLRGNRVLSHHAWVRSGRGSPFVTLPPELLVDGGYVQMDADSLILYGVGPAVVLSELFLEQHCFGLRDGGDERVGLEFRPIRAPSGRPDVRGVLWLDRATAELRSLEFTYTGLSFRGPVDRLGGELTFQRLPNGGWIVSRWAVRGPLLTRSASWVSSGTSILRSHIRGLRETSGEVLSVQDAAGRPVRMQ